MKTAASLIIFNGEIYNYLELREELLALGHPLSHQLRHRGVDRGLPGLGARRHPPVSWHVRLCPVGRADTSGWCWRAMRSARSRCSSQRDRARFFSLRDRAARSFPGFDGLQCRSARPLPSKSLRSGSPDVPSRSEELQPGPLCGVAGRQLTKTRYFTPPIATRIPTSVVRRCGVVCSKRPSMRRFAFACGAMRRSGLIFGRHRFVGGCRDHGQAQLGACANFLVGFRERRNILSSIMRVSSRIGLYRSQ